MVLLYFCTKLMYYIRREGKKCQSLTPVQKASRVQPSSHCPMKYLSPKNLKLRRGNASKERKSMQRKVSPITYVISNGGSRMGHLGQMPPPPPPPSRNCIQDRDTLIEQSITLIKQSQCS